MFAERHSNSNYFIGIPPFVSSKIFDSDRNLKAKSDESIFRIKTPVLKWSFLSFLVEVT